MHVFLQSFLLGLLCGRMTELRSRPRLEPTMLQLVFVHFQCAQLQGRSSGFCTDPALQSQMHYTCSIIYFDCIKSGFFLHFILFPLLHNYFWGNLCLSCRSFQFQLSCPSNPACLFCFCRLRELASVSGVGDV